MNKAEFTIGDIILDIDANEHLLIEFLDYTSEPPDYHCRVLETGRTEINYPIIFDGRPHKYRKIA